MTTILGLENFLADPPAELRGQRVGLVVSASSTDRGLVSTVERLHAAPGVRLTALFGPEHGLRGEVQAGEAVESGTDHLTGLPVYSLYGAARRPTPAMLADVDIFVIDMQDGGARFYTYLYTMAHVMQAAAETGRRVIVLDRPAPLNGLTCEGPLLEDAYASFVGLYPLPVRYGLTIGECARLFNTAYGIGCDLRVIPLSGWERRLWYDETGLPFVPPSPNLPTLNALTVYPGTCLFEGTTLSEGRGTTRPFEYIGAPWIQQPERLAVALNDHALPGTRFRAVYFMPAFSKHAGSLCRGVQLYVTDREAFRPVETAVTMLDQIRRDYPAHFGWVKAAWSGEDRLLIDLLTGSARVREHLEAARPLPALFSQWQSPLQAFDALRRSVSLY